MYTLLLLAVFFAEAETLEVKHENVHVALIDIDRRAEHPDALRANPLRPLRCLTYSSCNLSGDFEAFFSLVLPDEVEDAVEQV